MGFSSDAHCFACGHDAFLKLGGGMLNFTTYAAWPVSCATCSAVAIANVKSAPLRCETCSGTAVRLFSDPELPPRGGKKSLEWDGLWLADGRYRCPACGAFELRFGTNAGGHIRFMWD